jgi:hypothetical protein
VIHRDDSRDLTHPQRLGQQPVCPQSYVDRDTFIVPDGPPGVDLLLDHPVAESLRMLPVTGGGFQGNLMQALGFRSGARRYDVAAQMADTNAACCERFLDSSRFLNFRLGQRKVAGPRHHQERRRLGVVLYVLSNTADAANAGKSV